MTVIRVNPPDLRRNADHLGQFAGQLRAVAETVLRSTEGAPSYDGDFGPKVQSIGVEAQARLGALGDRVTARALFLHTKADAFQAADLAGVNEWGSSVLAIAVDIRCSRVFLDHDRRSAWAGGAR